ncbi:hypothetical protein [Aquisphaera giovannonii]|uniref:hypothetical protein n=1 Tax=Aquisphaera giovannonii TaxID=406548 RepID=UPI00143D532F|nr:hypothetical protein [Aquisphaera giovannonii]
MAQVLALPLLSQTIGGTISPSTTNSGASQPQDVSGLGTQGAATTATPAATANASISPAGDSPLLRGAMLALAASTVPVATTPGAPPASLAAGMAAPTAPTSSVATALPADVGLAIPTPRLPDSVVTDASVIAGTLPGITAGPLPAAVPEPGPLALPALLAMLAGTKPGRRWMRRWG